MRGITWVAVAAAILGVQACATGESGTSTSNGVELSQPSSPSDPAPKPKPEVSLRVLDRTVHTDSLTLTGRVQPKSAKVRIDGKPVDVSHGHWSLPVTLTERGDTSFRVAATRKGYVADVTTAVVTRELSAAEKAAIRQERAERRANARALESAESYLEMSGFSYQGLYEQLSSSAGEGFSESEAQYAVDHVGADWNHEAVESAKSYLEMMPMSKSALIDQLSSSAGEGFTYEQATYAANKVY
jgi:hypothetical protein